MASPGAVGNGTRHGRNLSCLPQASQSPMIALSEEYGRPFNDRCGLSIAVPTVLAYTYLNAKIDDQEETLYRGLIF